MGATVGDAEHDRLVDVDDLIVLTSELHELRERIVAAQVPPAQRRRWHRALATIAELGVADLDRAIAELRRLAAAVARGAGR